MHFPSTTFLSAILAGSLGMGLWATSPMAEESKPKPQAAPEIRAVLELFTSQGCSSCPPADALLEKYAARSDVIALSMPVDYWDYLGWKDTLASPKFSARQKYYAKERGDGRVYTPQMMINGRVHAVGSSADQVETAITSTEPELAASRVPVKITVGPKRLVIETGEAQAGAKAQDATIWLAMVHREATIKIERGENRGKTVKYVNVVRELNPIGMWTGKAVRHEISREAVTEPGNELCVVLLQVGKAGPIIGAARADGL